MNCPKCGKEVDDAEMAYCPHCGTQLKWIMSEHAEIDNKPNGSQIQKPSLYCRPWRPIGYMNVAVGVVLLVSGFFAGSYVQSEYVGYYPLGYTRTMHPYVQFAFPLIVLGIAAFVVGLVSVFQKRAR